MIYRSDECEDMFSLRSVTLLFWIKRRLKKERPSQITACKFRRTQILSLSRIRTQYPVSSPGRSFLIADERRKLLISHKLKVTPTPENPSSLHDKKHDKVIPWSSSVGFAVRTPSLLHFLVENFPRKGITICICKPEWRSDGGFREFAMGLGFDLAIWSEMSFLEIKKELTWQRPKFRDSPRFARAFCLQSNKKLLKNYRYRIHPLIPFMYVYETGFFLKRK